MTTSTTHIATARPEDSAQVIQMIRQYWEYEQLKPFNAEAIGKLVSDIIAHPELGQCWVAHSPGGLSGYLICTCVPSFEYGGLLALIADLYVVADARRGGVGQQLVHAAEQAMRKRGCVHIAMEVAERNIRAQQFYSILGFATRAGYSMMHKPLK